LISIVLDKLNQGQPHSLIPDVSVNSMSDTIEVAVDRVGDDSSDDSSSTRSSFDDSESESELTTSQPRGLQHKSTQRRRWTSAEENLLRRLKSTQKRNGMPSDCEIASKLDRTESGVKQHWDIMLQKSRRKY
jgi:DNA-binding NarL/FixJ family response regulator